MIAKRVVLLKRKLLLIRDQFVSILFVSALIFIVAVGYKSNTITTEDISNARSIQAIHLVSKYKKEEVKTKQVSLFSDVIKYGNSMPVIFSGVMTGYGPDCVGCGGRTGCPPRQNVKNGNIYFNDQEYGKVYIVATDSRIPCGTIVKIRNSNIAPEITAIALDRGGAIKEKKMDLLVESESYSSAKIGKQNVIYEIVRWGW